MSSFGDIGLQPSLTGIEHASQLKLSENFPMISMEYFLYYTRYSNWVIIEEKDMKDE